MNWQITPNLCNKDVRLTWLQLISLSNANITSFFYLIDFLSKKFKISVFLHMLMKYVNMNGLRRVLIKTLRHNMMAVE